MEKLPIDFNSFSKGLLEYLLQCVIIKGFQKEHKFKDGDIVFYYDSQFSNIHRLNLRKDSEDKDLTAEVLYNTECYNEGKEWDLLTGIYFWLPDKKKVMGLVGKVK
jgi:hypothetical protein